MHVTVIKWQSSARSAQQRLKDHEVLESMKAKKKGEKCLPQLSDMRRGAVPAPILGLGGSTLSVTYTEVHLSKVPCPKLLSKLLHGQMVK